MVLFRVLGFVAIFVLIFVAACGARTDPPPSADPAPVAAAPGVRVDGDAKVDTDAKSPGEPTSPEPDQPDQPDQPEPAAVVEPTPAPAVLAIAYPVPRVVPGGAVAAAVGPVEGAPRYCEAYMRTAPAPQRFNAHIMLDSECTVLGGPSSDEGLSPAEPLPALGPPYRDVVLIRTRAPYDGDDFEEIRVAIVTERGTFIEERGVEIANWLPASAVTLRSATVQDVLVGGEPELRIGLERFIGADEGVPEQYQVVELVCGFGASGAFACARFESGVEQVTVPRSPVSPRALRRIVLP